MTGHHEPRPEFVSHLEWQLRTALQREHRFTEPVKSQIGGKMKIGALVLASALMGAGGVVVGNEVQEAKAQEIRVLEAEGRVEMASLELEIVRSQFMDIERMFEVGTVDEESLMEARVMVAEAESALVLAQLDLEELRLTGREPDDELTAPLVEGRDFVAERLSHEERVAQEWYQLSFRRYLRMQELFEIGVVEARDLSEADVAAREAEGQLDLLALRSRMRHEFLAGELTAEAAELDWEAREAEAQVQVLEGVLQTALEELQALEERVEAGVVRDTETRQARLELLRTELELDMARLRLQQLRSGGGKDLDS
jgi:hypothetical protein